MFRFAQFATGRIRRGGHDSATIPWALIQVHLLDGSVELSLLLEQNAIDELRNDRRNRDLDIPFLSGYPGMHGHVLHRELNLNGQAPSSRSKYYPSTRSSSPRRRRSWRWVANSSGSCQAGRARRRWITTAEGTRR